MPSRPWAPEVGAIAANGTTFVSLASRRDLPESAGLQTVMVRNNSLAVLTVLNAPGGPLEVDPGERVEFGMDGARQLVLQADAQAVSAGQVKLQLEVEW